MAENVRDEVVARIRESLPEFAQRNGVELDDRVIKQEGSLPVSIDVEYVNVSSETEPWT